jgi:hypothetical protein
MSYDTAQQVVGVGSYKFDSGDDVNPRVRAVGVLGAARRVSFYWRYDSVPDVVETVSEFAIDHSGSYSGGGFTDSVNLLGSDDGVYATATPAKNSGQGSVFGAFSFAVSIGAVIDSVKIIYERKYDTDTSIGISRVKWVVNGEEGPDHDNADMPLTDTVVEVDVTADRSWEWQDFEPTVLEVIAEARRGDTDTAHTQSWDYVKVEVEFHQATVIARAVSADGTAFQIAVRAKDSAVVLRFADGAGVSYDGIGELAINSDDRISFAYVYHGVDNLDINVFLNGVPQLSISGASTGGFGSPLHLEYGWVLTPGVDHLCWFDQLYIDDGDDLTDPGSVLVTAKLPATANENNWNTVVGTGAVNERPLDEANHVKHTSPTGARQTYTLQDAATGDVDLTGETLIGYMGWAWAKLGGTDIGDALAFVVNGVTSTAAVAGLGATPKLLKVAATDDTYPSDAAGIGMVANDEASDTFLYEAGAVVAYVGPSNPDILLERQLLDTETLGTITDDLHAAPPTSYEVCCQFDDFDGTVEIVIHSLDQDGGSISYQGTLYSNGRTRISPGVEVYLDVTVTGVTMLQIWRRINFD